MIDFQHIFYLYGLPTDKFTEVQDWVDNHHQDSLWYMRIAGIIKKENGGGLIINSTYHPTRTGVGDFEIDLYKRWRNDCTSITYQHWNDRCGDGSSEGYYGLWFKLETDEEWKNYIENGNFTEINKFC